MTPATIQVRVETPGTALGAETFGRAAAVDAESSTAPKVQHKVLESLEDAVLLLVIVFALPAVIMLLALPIVVVFRVAAEVGRRW